MKNGGRLAAAIWTIQSKVPAIGLPMNIMMKELDVSDPNISSDSPTNLRVPGPCSLADERILKNSLYKAGFKDISVERQNVIFEFDSVNDYFNNVRI